MKLVGTKSNRDGLGARIKVWPATGPVQYNHATTSVGYGGSSDRRVYFGLGPAVRVDKLEVTWPSGIRQTLMGVNADQILTCAREIDCQSGSYYCGRPWPRTALSHVDANLPAARAYIAQGNFAKAAESLDQALAANPDAGSEPYLTLIDCRLRLGQKEKALEAARAWRQNATPVSGPLAEGRRSDDPAGKLEQRTCR